MNLIDQVRLKTGDRSTITREVSTGDGISLYFKLIHDNIILVPDIEVRIDGVTTTAVTMDYMNGVVTFSSPPPMNSIIDFQYYWAVYNNDEIQAFLDDSGANATIATARVLLAMAADAARLAKRLTLAGGAGSGQVVTDTSVAAKELRATAKALIDMEKDLGESIPFDQLTEPVWTEFGYQESLGQAFVRNGGNL